MDKPCNKGHISERRKNGNCIQCDRERYKSDPKRREYTLRKQAERRAIINADPELLEKKKEYMREYARKNRDRLREQNLRLYHKHNLRIRLRKKGIDHTPDVENYIKNHNGLCDLCGAPGDGRWGELNIDHCHSTKQFRGMLCSSCNRAIGYLKDNVAVMYRAAKYVESNGESERLRKALPNEYVPG